MGFTEEIYDKSVKRWAWDWVPAQVHAHQFCPLWPVIDEPSWGRNLHRTKKKKEKLGAHGVGVGSVRSNFQR